MKLSEEETMIYRDPSCGTYNQIVNLMPAIV